MKIKNLFTIICMLILLPSALVLSQTTPEKLYISGIASPTAANGIYVKQSGTSGSLGWAYWKHETQNYYVYCDQYSDGGYYWNIDIDKDDVSVLFFSDCSNYKDLAYFTSHFYSPQLVTNYVASGGTETNPTDITIIEYTAAAPEINITGNGSSIADGSTSPSFTNLTKFVSQNYSSGSVTRTYTISNMGTAALTISSVALSGTNANQYSITNPLSTTIAASSSTTFTVTFDPSSVGSKNAIVTVTNNDSNEGIYDFSIEGYSYSPVDLVVTGITTPSAANTTYIHQGVLNNYEYWLSSNGYYLYTDCNNWLIDNNTDPSTTDKVEFFANCSFTPSILDATVWTGSPGIGARGTGTPVITASAPTPNINAKGNNLTIAINSNTPTFSDYTKYGSVDFSSGSRSRTYTIENTGGAALTLSGIAFGGADAADFSVTTSPSSSVAAYGSTTFVVTFNPATAGTKIATLSISSNDPDENPYTFNISGDAFSQNNLIVSGITGTYVAANGTYIYQGISNEFQYWKHLTLNYYVYNSIYSNSYYWYIDADQVSTSLYDYLFSRASDAMAPVGLTSWTAGTGAAGSPTIVYASPEMDVKGNGTSISDGSASPNTANYTDLGTATVSSGTVSRTFTIFNTGYGALNLSGSPIVAISGTNSGDFTVSSQPTSSVAATSGTTTFTVVFDPSGSGTRSAEISIANNDSNESPYNFSIQGTGIDVPTVTNTTASSIATTSATLGGNVTAGGGATVSGRGVVYSTTDATPTIAEGATQSANASGGTGAFTQSVSSLTAGTLYYYNAYAINAAGVSYGTASSFATLYATPTTQASLVNLNSDAAGTTLTVSWTNGNGMNRAVFMKELTGTITNPTNGTSYTASTNWSLKGTQLGISGYYCIYNGTGSSVSVTNITPNTYYIAQAFEYNGAGSSSVFYTSTAIGNPSNYTSFPVELTTFAATAVNSGTTLSWQTSTEINNYGFEIERRAVNTTAWTKVGFVNGAGTSNSVKEYSFRDASISSGTYVYRLKQVDNNGEYKYSGESEVTIEVPRTFALNQNYPNPFNPTTNITFTLAEDSHISLIVFNMLGQKVLTLVDSELKAGVAHSVVFDASKLSTGIYFYRLDCGKNSLVKKLMLLK